MPIRRRISDPERTRRRFYGFAEAVARPPADAPNQRLSLLFDTVDADLFDNIGMRAFKGGAGAPDDKVLKLFRVLTTEKRLDQLGMDIPEETDWVEITIAKQRSWPRVWQSGPELDAEKEPVLNVIGLRLLREKRDRKRLKRLTTARRLPKARDLSAAEVLERLDLKRTKITITVLDVGQASCAAFSDEDGDIGYFDVGRPLPFNRKSFPKNFIRPYPKSGFVLLSHWDFDHCALGLDEAELRKLEWYAPYQTVNPRMREFQRGLGPRLHFIRGSAASNGVSLTKGMGSNPKDRNSTGYILRFEWNGEAVLLTGDADYADIVPGATRRLTSMAGPHHCGSASCPPAPAKCGFAPIAVASYGNPNGYKHPSQKHLQDLTTLGWQVQRTAQHLGSPRSNRILFPLMRWGAKSAWTQDHRAQLSSMGAHYLTSSRASLIGHKSFSLAASQESGRTMLLRKMPALLVLRIPGRLGRS